MLNCLGSGPFVKECPSTQRCKRCHQLHLSWLHVDPKSENYKAGKAGSHSGELTDVVTTNISQTAQHRQVLLMTCKVQILGPDVSATQTTALLDSASLTSFVTERLAQLTSPEAKATRRQYNWHWREFIPPIASWDSGFKSDLSES